MLKDINIVMINSYSIQGKAIKIDFTYCFGTIGTRRFCAKPFGPRKDSVLRFISKPVKYIWLVIFAAKTYKKIEQIHRAFQNHLGR